MAQYVSAGMQVDYASSLATAKSMTAISNDTSAVATLEASHGVAANEFVLFTTSGWPLLQGRVARASGVATNDVTFAGLDTSSTTLYPAGLGTGTVQEITWSSLGTVARDVQVSGGEPNYQDATLLSDYVEKELVTTLTPYRVTLPLMWDHSAAFVANAVTFTMLQSATAIRFRHPSGPVIVAGAKIVYKQMPTIENGILKSSIVVTFTGEPMVYTS